MIGLLLSSVSKHNMWSYYDWVVVLLTEDNDYPIIIRPHIVFTDGRQRQPNHITTTYCVYWRKTTSSISKHNMWSYYDWVVVVVFRQWAQYMVVLWLGGRCCRPSLNTICGCIMIELSLSSDLCLLTEDNNDNPIIIRPHIVFTDGRQQRQPNHNMTIYCVYWRTTTTTNPIILRPHIVFTDGRQQRQSILWLGCRYGSSVNTIWGRIMIGLTLSDSKHNMWS
jgi:hypothetical protein